MRTGMSRWTPCRRAASSVGSLCRLVEDNSWLAYCGSEARNMVKRESYKATRCALTNFEVWAAVHDCAVVCPRTGRSMRPTFPGGRTFLLGGGPSILGLTRLLFFSFWIVFGVERECGARGSAMVR